MQTTSSQVIIIGAGAAGLMAAYKLAKAGQKVTVLEARKRVGGRIHTLVNEQFSGVAETGAEFIHGDLPETLSLLREAGIRFLPAGGEMWHYKNGSLTQEAFIENWDLLMQRLNELQQDITISEFLSSHFPGEEHKELRTEVIRFASGYDNADPDRASTFALRREWQSDDEDAQHRLPDGYGAMIQYLASSVTQLEGTIHLATPVKEIKWQPSRVAAITSDGQTYSAEKMIVALPLGILQILPAAEGHIYFNPGIEKHSSAIQQLGFGAVIKVLLQFKTAFWGEETVTSVTGADFRNMGFILSEEAIPTWWTQNPQHSTLLTGWLGGLPAAAHTHSSDEELLRLSLLSLSNIFHLSIQFLEEQLTTSLVINWPADPYTRGGYAYDTVNAADARDIMMQPVADTIYFAGEYLYDGPYMGTVEAALTSGSLVARQIVKIVRK